MICVVCEAAQRNRREIANALALVEQVSPVEWLTTAEVHGASDDALGKYSGFFLGPGDYERPDAAVHVIRFARERGVPLVGT